MGSSHQLGTLHKTSTRITTAENNKTQVIKAKICYPASVELILLLAPASSLNYILLIAVLGVRGMS